jgi:hypothetical protein
MTGRLRIFFGGEVSVFEWCMDGFMLGVGLTAAAANSLRSRSRSSQRQVTYFLTSWFSSCALMVENGEIVRVSGSPKNHRPQSVQSLWS